MNCWCRSDDQYNTVVPNDSAVRWDRGIASSNISPLLGHHCIFLELDGYRVSCCDHRDAIVVVVHRDHFQVVNDWILTPALLLVCALYEGSSFQSDDKRTVIADYFKLPYRMYRTVLYLTVSTDSSAYYLLYQLFVGRVRLDPGLHRLIGCLSGSCRLSVRE